METGRNVKKSQNREQFKSYYVVWKQSLRRNNYGRNVKSLNRTMQYGNCDEVCRQRICKCRLNRTMQYGNKVTKEVVRKIYVLFKSYYVVWKPQ